LIRGLGTPAATYSLTDIPKRWPVYHLRPPELETGAEGEGDEGGAEGGQQPEGTSIWQVAPQLATPAKLPPAVLDPTVKTTRGRSPGGTPSRGEVVRRNAADRMEAELDAALKCEQQWAVVVAVPKEVRELSVAEENEEEETRMARRGHLCGDLDQNFQAVQEH
jgi:hypothetical protein